MADNLRSGMLKIVIGVALISAGICVHFLRVHFLREAKPTGDASKLTRLPASQDPATGMAASGIGTGAISAMFAKLTPCPAEADSAALDKLYPLLGHVDQASASSLDHGDKTIACLRPWAEGLADPCQKNGLLHWLDYYEGRIAENRVKLEEAAKDKLKPESDSEKYMRELREKEARTREYVRQHPFPKLPQCEDK